MPEFKLDKSEYKSNNCWLFSTVFIITLTVMGISLLEYLKRSKVDHDVLILSILLIVGFLLILLSFIYLTNKKDESKLNLKETELNTKNLTNLKMKSLGLRTKLLDERLHKNEIMSIRKNTRDRKIKFRTDYKYKYLNLSYDRVNKIRLGGI